MPSAFRIDHFGLFTDGMTRIAPDIGDMPLHDSNVDIRDDLAGLYTDPPAVLHDEVGVDTPHGDVNECSGQFGGR